MRANALVHDLLDPGQGLAGRGHSPFFIGVVEAVEQNQHGIVPGPTARVARRQVYGDPPVGRVSVEVPFEADTVHRQAHQAAGLRGSSARGAQKQGEADLKEAPRQSVAERLTAGATRDSYTSALVATGQTKTFEPAS